MSLSRVSRRIAVCIAGLISLCAGATAAGASPNILFESGQVRPLALSPSGKLLFAVNTPDHRIEVFKVSAGTLVHQGSVSVGLEPVAVAARNEAEIWVVNHLSDSISVVDVSEPSHPRVVRTLLVGDEPRDLVFAGHERSRAFVTCAHRGQNAPFDPQLTTPGVGRADVWVFNAKAADATLGGSPLAILNLFTDTPRALAVSPDGAKVYAAGFHTGNRTTTLQRFVVEDGGGLPPPFTNHAGEAQPLTGLIVQFNGLSWVDGTGRPWDTSVRFSLPDKDVFTIDATANPPAIASGQSWSGVGTILYNMAVNPVSGKVYVTNTEALNLNRFEGPGVFAGTTVRGHFAENRITVLNGATVAPRHLNKHINYAACCAPVPNAESEKSLAIPLGMAVSDNGKKLYVAAMGSDKVGVLDTAALENDTFVPSAAAQIEVSGGGPTGVVLDDERHRLYVLTRFDDGISVINTTSRAEIQHLTMPSPEPPAVVSGRRHLYDARSTSSHGDSACASCHVFGDTDSLAWDLGNPDGDTLNNPGPFFLSLVPDPDFVPMKGPMTTQSLRGMANHGPMHWRGDRTGGNDTATAQPDSGSFDERAAFAKFQVGFTGLLGRHAPISPSDMEDLTDFVLELSYPPNPIRHLDDSLTPDQQAGRDHFFAIDGAGPGLACQSCHTLDRQGNSQYGVDKPGFFGTSGLNVGGENVLSFKIPHFRNLYQKVGMFGMADAFPQFFPGDNGFKGDQVRGFGYTHDGAADTVFRFTQSLGFEQNPFATEGFLPGAAGDVQRRQVEQFLLAFDSNLKPVVGQQATLRIANATAAGPRIDLLLARADAGDCEVVAKVRLGNEELGFLYAGQGSFKTNRQAWLPIPDGLLRLAGVAFGQSITYTAVPPGSGHRIALDRDGDGALDGDELDDGTDPAMAD
jgi:DNA-binding beta-propeller fold protein YncE